MRVMSPCASFEWQNPSSKAGGLFKNLVEDHMLKAVSRHKPPTVSEESMHGRTLFA